jgi:hypothetical protein
LIDRFQELFSIEIVFAMLNFIAMDTNCEVLCHLSFFYRGDANRFQCIAEIDQCLVAIQFAAEGETPCPREDAGNRIC